MKKLLIILFFIPNLSFSQELAYGNKIEAIEICKQLNFGSKPISLDKEVDETLNKILSIVGLKKNFQLQICSNINNAAALTYNGVRYIFYDKDFLNSISGENRWFVTFILAHEVAHHLNDHSKDYLMYLNGFPEDISIKERRNQELEADEWAGFILGKLEASYTDAINAVSQLPNDEYNDPSSNHPDESLRIEALVKGYNIAIEGIGGLNFGKYEGANTGKYLIYFYQGIEKFKSGDLDGAIKDFEMAIIDKKEFPEPYINKAIARELQGDIIGAISDIELAMNYNPNLDLLYIERGALKEKLGKYESAINDYNKAILINKKSLGGYFNRAVLKWNLYNNLFPVNDYSFSDPENILDIIEDFSKCIEIHTDYLEARTYRAAAILKGISIGNFTISPIAESMVDTAFNDVNISISYSDIYEERDQSYNLFTGFQTIQDFKLLNYNTRASLNMLYANYAAMLSDADEMIDLSKGVETDSHQYYFVQGYIFKIVSLYDKNSYFFNKLEACKNINYILDRIYDDFNLNNPKTIINLSLLGNLSETASCE